MKIIVDAFGGDNAPLEILKGCAQAVEEYGLEILLTGSRSEIERVAKENQIPLTHMEIADAPDVITMEDSAGEITKSKKNCSMAEGLRRLAAGEGDAFLSAGNSGALVVGATLIVKRIRGIKRCAFAPIMPKDEGCFMLIDSGANLECRPEQLQQFGIMGSIYMERVMGVRNPRVGLANVGTEDHKGGELQHETFALLKQSPLNFIGNIEARDIPMDAADVIVSDGFTGNVILKLYEGVAMTLMGKIKGILTKGIKNKVAAALILPDMKVLKKQMDYNEYGGAPIMGISKPVFKAHGSAKAKTFKNALRLTAAYVQGNVVGEISQAISQMESQSPKE
ncbi:MAG: phosphate acyltransferase PlsX [Clostridiales bacterium]|jgi:glycerol-3-phosphate acyltransferase PlsX|nr:phosphate acyltransferase PlsX [Clostridiales bacterium]